MKIFIRKNLEFDDDSSVSAIPVMYLSSNASEDMKEFVSFVKEYVKDEKDLFALCKKCNLDGSRWDFISKYICLSDRIIRKFHEHLNWKIMTTSQRLNVKTMEEFSDKINWKAVASFQRISSAFIERNADKLEWYDVSRYGFLKKETIVRHRDLIVWHALDRNKNVCDGVVDAARKEIADKFGNGKNA